MSATTCGPLIYHYAKHNSAGGYILLMRSSESSLVIQGKSSVGGFDDLEEWLSIQDGVDLAFSNNDARVYRVAP
jgi:hypothetical protein